MRLFQLLSESLVCLHSYSCSTIRSPRFYHCAPNFFGLRSSAPHRVHPSNSITTTRLCADSSTHNNGEGGTADTSSHSLPPLSDSILSTLDPCVVLMKKMIGEYEDSWKTKGDRILSLAQGVVWWTPPDGVREALVEALTDDTAANTDTPPLLHMYGPDEGLPELRAALIDKLVKENGLNKHIDVIVTMGANQAYMNCVLTLMGRQRQGDSPNQAVVFAPYYFNHVMALQMTIGDDNIRMGQCSENTGLPDLDWLANELETNPGITMVTLCNPCNPTGVWLDPSRVLDVVELTRKHQAWLILDCTYEYFCHQENSFLSWKGILDDAPHVLLVYSFSKSYGLAGYRCGYVALHEDAQLVSSSMRKVQDTIPIGPARISQVAALAALRSGGPAWVHKKIQTLSTGRDLLGQALDDLPIRMGGSGAMYYMAKLPPSSRLAPDAEGYSGENDNDDVIVARRLVRDYGIAIIPGTYCGWPGWIRVCYANLPPALCNKAAERLRRGLIELYGTA